MSLESPWLRVDVHKNLIECGYYVVWLKYFLFV